MKYLLTLVAVSILTAPALAQRAPLTDHDLVAPYEGSVLRRKNVIEFDEYSAFMGMDETAKEPTGLALEGKVTTLFYNMPKDRSILEVYRNYQMAMQQAGAEILYECNQEKYECAESYAAVQFQKYSGIHGMANNIGRYMLAKIEQDGNTAYIAITAGRSFSDIHVVEVKAMQTGMVMLDADALGKGLDARGYVIVEGIFFDTDKTTLKAESSGAMAEMAKLLQERPDLNVYVVGHTDMQGSLAHNMALSDGRARAVVDALANDFSIDRSRMDGKGVGPLAPQSSNSSDNGRAKNRRVVLVAR